MTFQQIHLLATRYAFISKFEFVCDAMLLSSEWYKCSFAIVVLITQWVMVSRLFSIQATPTERRTNWRLGIFLLKSHNCTPFQFVTNSLKWWNFEIAKQFDTDAKSISLFTLDGNWIDYRKVGGNVRKLCFTFWRIKLKSEN